MTSQSPRYRFEDGAWLIEIELESVQQLFNSFDPSPFHIKDLDDDAERWIVGAVRDFPIATPLRLVLHLPQAELGRAEAAGIRPALAGHFGERREAALRDLRYLLRTGRTALAVGLGFLGACLLARQLVGATFSGTASGVVAEGLLIIGWVAMWRPVEIFLYDWWPLRRMARVHEKIASLPVEVRGR